MLERYTTALQSRDLRQHTTDSDVDVLGAAGFSSTLATAVTRSDAGDVHAQREAAELLAPRIRGYAWRTHRTRVGMAQCVEAALLVLSNRRRRCEPCGGRGFRKLGNAPTLGPVCSDCGGRGRPALVVDGKRCLKDAAAWVDALIEQEQDRLVRSLRRRLKA